MRDFTILGMVIISKKHKYSNFTPNSDANDCDISCTVALHRSIYTSQNLLPLNVIGFDYPSRTWPNNVLAANQTNNRAHLLISDDSECNVQNFINFKLCTKYCSRTLEIHHCSECKLSTCWAAILESGCSVINEEFQENSTPSNPSH